MIKRTLKRDSLSGRFVAKMPAAKAGKRPVMAASWDEQSKKKLEVVRERTNKKFRSAFKTLARY